MKNKIIHSVVLASLLVGVAHSADSDRIINQMTGGKGVSSTTTNTDLDPHSRSSRVGNYEEVLYQHLVNSERDEEPVVPATPASYSYDISGAEKEKEKIAHDRRLALLEAENKIIAQEKIDSRPKYARGYCYLSKEIIIERLASYAELNCDFNNPIGHATLTVSMVPEFYAKAVIGNPLYVTKNEERFPISNGVVMTKDKNSINLANFVNDRLTQKIAASSLYKGVGVVAQGAQAYLTQKEQSRIQQQVVVQPGLTPVTTIATNTLPPDPYTYLAATGIQLASVLAKTIGENYVNSLPYTFKLNAGSVFYVDVQFAHDGNMEGYKIKQPNLVRPNPTFIDGREQQVKIEKIPVLNNHSQYNVSNNVGVVNTRVIRPPVSTPTVIRPITGGTAVLPKPETITIPGSVKTLPSLNSIK